MTEETGGLAAAAPLRVLTLDGGGAKGFYTLGVLKEIEAMIGCPLHQKFDLVFGTSTGAIIASLIALGHDVDERNVQISRVSASGNVERWNQTPPFWSKRANVARLYRPYRREMEKARRHRSGDGPERGSPSARARTRAKG